MWFAIIARDNPSSLDQRLAVRGEHLARLNALQAEGRLMLAGPFPSVVSDDSGSTGFTGSLIVAAFTSQAQAESWVRDDPYQTTGVYASVEIKPFRKTLPCTAP